MIDNGAPERLVLPLSAATSLAVWFTGLFGAMTAGAVALGWVYGIVRPVYLPAILGAWVFGLAAFWLVGIQLTRLHWGLFEPLHREIQKLATGDFTVSLPSPSAFFHPQVRVLAEGIHKVTERLRGFAELEVEQIILEKAELEAVIFSMTEGLVIYDLDFQAILTNPALEQIAQPAVQATAFLDRRNLFLGRWADPQRILEIERHMREAPELPRVDIVELIHPRQFFKRYSSPLYNKDRKQVGHVVVFHDVTGEIEADQMKSEFVSNASHELRTPVTSMKVLVENVLDMLEDVHNQAEVARLNRFDADFDDLDRAIVAVKGFAADVYAEANRMHQLVDDLLDVAKLNSRSAELSLHPVDGARVIEEAVATVAPQARKKGIELSLNLPGDIALVADRVRLRQVLVNLLGNAVKYTPDRGAVTLTVTSLGTVWEFAVADNGIGIPEDDLEHVFDRFFRVGRDRARVQGSGGSGLGLSIARSAVEAHGGQMVVESKVGHGTTFRFTLPKTLEAKVLPSQEREAADAIRRPWLG